MNIIAADVHLTTHTPRDAQKQRASLNDETTDEHKLQVLSMRDIWCNWRD